ncbi:hypothetical protein GCM10010245_86660 [Streptomyces spectabilis]|nr:hypothetical protein GCM10010245_86660 [Streptomyces spectabilis]
MFRRSSDRTGKHRVFSSVDENTVHTLSELWRKDLGGVITSSATLVGKRVYVGSADRHLYALDVERGGVLWRYNANAVVSSSPAIREGRVFFTAEDGSLHVLEGKTGKHLWSRSAGYGQSSAAVISPAPGNDGSSWVYVGSGRGTVEAFDSDGNLQWSFATRGPVRSSPAIAAGTVYIGSDDNGVYALDARTGKLKWSASTGGNVTATPAVAKGMLYVGSHDASMYAMDTKNGRIVWTHRTRRGPIRASAALGTLPSTGQSAVYVGADDGYFYAFDARRGQTLWSRDFKSPIMSSAAVTTHVLYVGAGSSVVGLAPGDGRLLWSKQLSGLVNASPSLARDQLVVGSSGHFLHAFGLPSPVGSPSPTSPAPNIAPAPPWAQHGPLLNSPSQSSCPSTTASAQPLTDP